MPSAAGASCVAVLALVMLGTSACGGDEERDGGRLRPTVDLEVAALESAPGVSPARAPEPGSGALATWTPQSGSGSGAAIGTGATPGSVLASPQPPALIAPTSVIAIAPGAPPEFTPPADIPQPTLRPALAVAEAGPPATDPEIVDLMRQVRSERLRTDVRRLVGFGTRHVLSETTDRRRGIGATRDWLFEVFSPTSVGAGSQVVVQREPFPMSFGGRVTDQENIMATLTGIGRQKRLVYIAAHYDSRVADVADGQSDAPGADDNASGVAGLLELVRVLGTRQWDASIRLVAFAGEEQGMHGSAYHAPAAKRLGLPIQAVFNLDVIGGGADAFGASIDDHLRVFSGDPDDGPSRGLARHIAVMAARYGPLRAELVPQSDREGRQSDHLPFADAGYPAARLIAGSEDTSRQHTGADTLDRMDVNYHADVVRLTVALAANLALAPSAPTVPPVVTNAPTVPGAANVSLPLADDPVVVGHYVAWRVAGETAYRGTVWTAQPTLTIDGLPAGAEIHVAFANVDDRGHTSLFGPEARIQLP